MSVTCGPSVNQTSSVHHAMMDLAGMTVKTNDVTEPRRK